MSWVFSSSKDGESTTWETLIAFTGKKKKKKVLFSGSVYFSNSHSFFLVLSLDTAENNPTPPAFLPPSVFIHISKSALSLLWASSKLRDHRSLSECSYITPPGSSLSSWHLVTFTATECYKEWQGFIFQSNARKQVWDITNPTKQAAPCNSHPLMLQWIFANAFWHLLAPSHLFLYRQDLGLWQHCPSPAAVLKLPILSSPSQKYRTDAYAWSWL